MSDEESLLQRFNRCFWQDYVGGLCSSEFLIERTRTTAHEGEILRNFRLLSDQVRSAGFSVSQNEELDDVTSAGLLFLVLPYTIGDLLYNHSKYDRESRIPLLTEVKSCWENFLMYMTQLRICSDFDRCGERSRKIQAQLRQNELQKVVVQLHYRFCRSGVSSDIDERREDVIRLLEFFTLKVRNDIRFVMDEIALLQTEPGDSQANVQQPPHDKKKLWSMKLDKTLIRSIKQNEVFRPDICMPSMSLHEFAQIEYEKALRLNVDDVNKNRDTGDDHYARERLEEMQNEEKDRVWDDWKDENPRGSGNKLVNKG